MKEIAKELLWQTHPAGNGGYVCEFGPYMYGRLKKIILGEMTPEEYCLKNGHSYHMVLPKCIICREEKPDCSNQKR